jgi:deoxyribodipyrimidine photolyase-related protein
MRRWLFADQLGPHFLDDPDQPVLLIEARSVFRRRRFHRQKAHLVLSALRHRAAELGERCLFVQTDTYGEALARVGEPLSVCQPTSYAADRFVRGRPGITVLPARGFLRTREEFTAWARGRGQRRLLLEDFYRDARRRLDILMDGTEPVGGRWNYDADNRELPPAGARTLDLPEPWWPAEDDIDAQVRADLDRWEREEGVSFLGRDGPRWPAATRSEALRVAADFLTHRLAGFGPHEDAMLAGDPTMAHSLVSAPLNLGLLDPLELIRRAERAYRRDGAPLASVEGFVRQLAGGGTMCGTPTGRRGRTTGSATHWRPPPRCRRGGLISMPTPSRPGACARCWPAYGIGGGSITSPG